MNSARFSVSKQSPSVGWNLVEVDGLQFRIQSESLLICYTVARAMINRTASKYGVYIWYWKLLILMVTSTLH